MTTPKPFCKLNFPCDDALQWTKTELDRAGLRVIQTFDLHTVRHVLAECPCLHHGTNACDCQMVILLVFEREKAPVTLMFHSNGKQTWISTVDASSHDVAGTDLSRRIQAVFEKKSDSSVSTG